MVTLRFRTQWALARGVRVLSSAHFEMFSNLRYSTPYQANIQLNRDLNTNRAY